MKTAVCKIHGQIDENTAYLCVTKGVRRGWRLRCKKCSQESKIKAYEKHREKHLDYSKQYAKDNREKIREKERLFRINNPKKIKEKDKRQYIIRALRKTDLTREKLNARKRGVNLEEVKKARIEQNGICAICENPETRRSTRNDQKTAALCIDHNHKTGQFRALLCGACNTAIGHFKENIELMERAIAYLKKHS